MKSHILFSQEAAVWFKEMRGGRRSRVKWRCLATFIFYSFFSYGSCIHLWLVNMQLTGAQNDGFFLNTLKTLLRLSRVLLDLWKCILSGAKKVYLFGHPRRTWVFSKLQGLQYYFPENFRCNLTFYESENFSYSSLHHVFESENFRFPFYYE